MTEIEKKRYRKKMYLREWRKQQRLKGLCVDCSKPVVEGKIRCQYHLDKQLEIVTRYKNKHQTGRKKKRPLTKAR